MATPTTTTITNEAPTTYTAQMRNNDKHWIWKTGLRSLLLIVDIIGIGAVASIVAQMIPRGSDTYDQSGYGFTWFPWGLIPLSASAIWCSIVLLIHFIRRRPSHPGVAVGLDLVLWLALIVTVIFIGIGLSFWATDATDNISWGGSYSRSGYYGSYEKAANGTWIYKMTPSSSSSDQFYNVTTGTYQYLDTSATLIRDPCTPEYPSCQEQDAAFNRMMSALELQHRVGLLGAVCQGLALVLHFILFVWACVDTSRHRRGDAEGRATVIAERIIQDMVNRGQITVHQGATQGTRPLLRPDSNRTAGSAGGFGNGEQQQQPQMTMNPAAAPTGGYYAPGPSHQPHQSYPQAPPPAALYANQSSRGPSPAPTSPLPQIPHQHHQQQQTATNRAPSPLAPTSLNTHTPGSHVHDPPSPISPAGGEAASSGHATHAS